MGSVESNGVATESLHLISSVVITFQKARAARRLLITLSPFALVAIEAWEIVTVLMSGMRSLHPKPRGDVLRVSLENSDDLGSMTTKPKYKFGERADSVSDEHITTS